MEVRCQVRHCSPGAQSCARRAAWLRQKRSKSSKHAGWHPELDMQEMDMTDRKYLVLIFALAVLAACGKAADADASAAISPDVVAADAIAADATVHSMGNADTLPAGQATAQKATSLRASFKQCAAASGGVDAAMQDCIAGEYAYQDGRLNANYAAIKRSFSADKMTGFKVAQRQWLRDRDAKCAWDAKTEGSAQRLQANYCSM